MPPTILLSTVGTNLFRPKFDQTTIRLLYGMNGRTLADIRSVEDNTAAANQNCEIVRELTRHPQTRLHASAAGGRKTMSIYLTAAMQLFGRVQDRLSHVMPCLRIYVRRGEAHRGFSSSTK